jgi:hypothetical protein
MFIHLFNIILAIPTLLFILLPSRVKLPSSEGERNPFASFAFVRLSFAFRRFVVIQNISRLFVFAFLRSSPPRQDVDGPTPLFISSTPHLLNSPSPCQDMDGPTPLFISSFSHLLISLCSCQDIDGPTPLLISSSPHLISSSPHLFFSSSPRQDVDEPTTILISSSPHIHFS